MDYIHASNFCVTAAEMYILKDDHGSMSFDYSVRQIDVFIVTAPWQDVNIHVVFLCTDDQQPLIIIYLVGLQTVRGLFITKLTIEL